MEILFCPKSRKTPPQLLLFSFSKQGVTSLSQRRPCKRVYQDLTRQPLATILLADLATSSCCKATQRENQLWITNLWKRSAKFLRTLCENASLLIYLLSAGFVILLWLKSWHCHLPSCHSFFGGQKDSIRRYTFWICSLIWPSWPPGWSLDDVYSHKWSRCRCSTVVGTSTHLQPRPLKWRRPLRPRRVSKHQGLCSAGEKHISIFQISCFNFQSHLHGRFEAPS